MTDQEFLFKFRLIKATKNLESAAEALDRMTELSAQLAASLYTIKEEIDAIKKESEKQDAAEHAKNDV